MLRAKNLGRYCGTCKTAKPLSDFYRSALDTRNGARCRACCVAAQRKRRQGKQHLQSAALTDRYVRKALRLPAAQVSGDLIKLKREQLALKRLTKELNNAIKESNDGRPD